MFLSVYLIISTILKNWMTCVPPDRAATIRFIALLSISIICSALLLHLCISRGEIASAAPGQSVSSRLILESDGGEDIFIDVPGSIDDWVLVPSISPNERQMGLKVQASTGWQMVASCDRADGRMAEYDLASSEYVPGGEILEDPLHITSSWIEGPPDTLEVIMPEGGLIRQGGETPIEDRQFLVTLGQKVAWTDEPLDYGHAYRIALTFEVSPSG